MKLHTYTLAALALGLLAPLSAHAQADGSSHGNGHDDRMVRGQMLRTPSGTIRYGGLSASGLAELNRINAMGYINDHVGDNDGGKKAKCAPVKNPDCGRHFHLVGGGMKDGCPMASTCVHDIIDDHVGDNDGGNKTKCAPVQTPDCGPSFHLVGGGMSNGCPVASTCAPDMINDHVGDGDDAKSKLRKNGVSNNFGGLRPTNGNSSGRFGN